MYSAEEESASFKFPDHVSQEVKQDRFNRLMAAQQGVVVRRSEEWATTGKLLEVVIDGAHPEDETVLFGRHEGQVGDVAGCGVAECSAA
jgi:ribosomal protein S12 methylthiotransferase